MTSPFAASLEQICDALDGAVVATLMGTDGLPVEQVTRDAPPAPEAASLNGAGDRVEVDALLVEFSSLLGQVQRTAQVFSAGGLEELAIRSERLTTIIRLVTEDYFLAVALRPGANFGKARYLLRVTAPKLVPELS